MTLTRRHIFLKALSWQALGLVTSLLITYAYTGSIAASWALTMSLTATGLIMYMLHERAWGWALTKKLARPDPPALQVEHRS